MGETAPHMQAQTVTYAFTGAAQSWTVPAGVSQATFDLFGAQGGSGAETPNFSGPGGLGGETTVTPPLTAGQVVQINVGGAGANGNSAGCSIGYPMKVSCGGFNGGATSGLGVRTPRTIKAADEAAHPTFGLAPSAWTIASWWPAVAAAAVSATRVPVAAAV